MRMRSNKVGDVAMFIKSELLNIYNDNEIAALISAVFEEYAEMSKTDLIIYADKCINESVLIKINDAVRLLKNEYPFQYITGKKYFLNCIINVNPSTLIPRPETEELTDLIIKDCVKKNILSPSVIDIGTGSGCIAVALKKNIINADVTAIDISKDALTTAMNNALLNDVAIDFIEFDITDNKYYNNLNIYDIIISNPPYVTEKEKTIMKKNVLNHEPHSALFVPDNNPLKFYKYIAEFAKHHLKPDGKIYLEINCAFAVEISTLFRQYGFRKVLIKKDLFSKDRFAEIAF